MSDKKFREIPIGRRDFVKASGGAAGLGIIRQTTDSGGGSDRGAGGSSPTYIPLNFRTPGALYEPVQGTGVTGRGRGGRKSRVGFVIMHQSFSVLTADQIPFTSVSIGEEFAKRGYRALVADTEARAGSYHIHDILPDVGAAVQFFRDHPDVDTVVVVGYSRGASLMSFYQNVAENGTSVAQSDDRLFPAPDDLDEQPAADGVLILDGVLGTGPGGGSQPEGLLEVDPQIQGNDPQAIDPSLNVYAPENGFEPDGQADYSDAFLEAVFDAQATRMNEMIEEAQTTTQAIDAGNGDFPDDDEFLAVSINTPVADLDSDLLAHTSGEWPLLSTDGSVSIQQVPYVGPTPDADPEVTFDESLLTTVKRFLSTSSIRPTDDYRITEDSIEGLDYDSTNAEAPGNLEGVSAPLLIMGFTGDRNYLVHCEIMMNHAGSSDKSLMYVEGAGHGFEPLDPQYGDTAELIFDTVDEWAAERFV